MSLATFRSDLTHYLAAAGLGLTVGTNLFRGQIPATIPPTTLVVLVQMTGGQESERFLSQRVHVQILVRSTDMDAAEAKAFAIHALLDNLAVPVAMGPTPGAKTRVADCKAIAPPHHLPPDERQAWWWSCNYRFTLST